MKSIFSALKKELPTAKYYSFPSGEKFLETWKEGAYDLIILDMFMHEMLGIEVARVIRETDFDVRLVFCTTSNEFASESYEVGANYYLHKPISDTSIQRMLKMIRLEDYESKRFIQFDDGQKVVLHQIIYSEYYKRSVMIYCKNDIVIQARISQTD